MGPAFERHGRQSRRLDPEVACSVRVPSGTDFVHVHVATRQRRGVREKEGIAAEEV